MDAQRGSTTSTVSNSTNSTRSSISDVSQRSSISSNRPSLTIQQLINPKSPYYNPTIAAQHQYSKPTVIRTYPDVEKDISWTDPKYDISRRNMSSNPLDLIHHTHQFAIIITVLLLIFTIISIILYFTNIFEINVLIGVSVITIIMIGVSIGLYIRHKNKVKNRNEFLLFESDAKRLKGIEISNLRRRRMEKEKRYRNIVDNATEHYVSDWKRQQAQQEQQQN